MAEKSLRQLLESEPEIQNKKIIKALYKAVTRMDIETIASVVASVHDLDWWYHGPLHCQHMMRILTGRQPGHIMDFKFRPRTLKMVDDRVIVEGWEAESKAYWVHVWSVDQKGTITQLREYFNTWLTVIVRDSEGDKGNVMHRLWRSNPRQRLKLSLPEVVLVV